MFGYFEVILFLCAICYLFSKHRTDGMVDVISTRLQEVYGSWRFPGLPGGTANNEPEEHLTGNQLRRFGDESRRRKAYAKDIENQTAERSLYEIKEAPVNIIPSPITPLQGLACRYCAPSNSEVQLDPVQRRRDVTDILRITQHAGWRPNSTIFDWGGWCPFLAQCVRYKKYIYPQVSGTVLKDERLRRAIEQATKEALVDKKMELRENAELSLSDELDKFDEDSYYQQKLKFNEKRAKQLLFEMRSKVSDFLLRVASWILYKLLPCFMSGVVAHPAQVEMLKAATERAPGVPLIFLPLHRSHLDYLLVSFILVNNDIRSPIVAAGNNLRIPFFGALLRGLGAFFIKRKIDPVVGKKDVVYRTILHTYMQQALAAGHNVEFFIEGGRTRTGKPCMPKNGILSVVLDAFMDGTIPDALLVPVSVNYERLVDGNFVYEQLGQKKKPETFRSAISAIWHILHSKYGLMRIDFNEPFSLRELVKSFNKSQQQNDTSNPMMRRLQHNPSTSSLYGTDLVQEEQRTLVDSIARHVVYDCASATSVMTTNAVAFLLLTRFRDGATMSVLATALDELRNKLEGIKDIGFTGESKNVIKYVADLLGSDLITMETRASQLFFKPVTQIPNVIELSYYSNCLTPHFALESIMVTALQQMAKEFEEKYPTAEFHTNRDELYKACLEHCDILRYEFILHKCCQNQNILLDDTLDKLKIQDIVMVPEITYTTEQQRAKRVILEIDESDDDDDYDDDDHDIDRYYERCKNLPENQVYLTPQGHCERLVLMSVLAPYGHTYLTVANCLNSLLGTTMTEGDFIKFCVNEITEKVTTTECKYGESISTDSIRNCIKLLEKWSVIEINSAPNSRVLSLGQLYNTQNGIQNIIQRIKKIVPF